MSSSAASLPAPTPDQRRTAAEHFQHANHWLVAHKPDKALPFLRHCFQLDPANIIYLQALHACRRQMKPAGGIVHAIKAWFASRRMHASENARNWPATLQNAEQVLDFYPLNIAAHLALARSFEAVDLRDQAVWSLEQVLDVDKDHSQKVKTELGRHYESVGRFTQARNLNAHPLAINPELRAEAELLRSRLEANQADAAIYLQLARLYRRASDFEAARDWLERGLMATKNDFELSLERAELDLDVLRQDVMIADEKLAGIPSAVDLKLLVHRLRHELQSRELDLCRLQAERQPADGNLRLALGVQLLKTGQFDSALEVFQSLRGDQEFGWRALVYSGYCHLNSGNKRRAAALFEEALPFIPPEAETTRTELQSLLSGMRLAPTLPDPSPTPRPPA